MALRNARGCAFALAVAAASVFTAVLTAGEADSGERTTTFAVYFHNAQLSEHDTNCDRVFPLLRTLPFTDAIARAALNSLFSGPTRTEEEQGYHSPFNERTRGILKNIRVDQQTAYVDLRDIRPIVPGTSSSCGSAEFLAEVETTLKQFPTVRRVIFAIEGRPRVFYDWIQAECNQSNDYCDPHRFVPTLSKRRPNVERPPTDRF